MPRPPVPAIMSVDRSKSGPVAGSSNRVSAILPRGRACNNCRRRKIKCDTRHPICTQCERSARPGEECTYTERSGTHALEEQITRLEARIRELEGAQSDPSLVQLHNPYTASSPGDLQQLMLDDSAIFPRSTSTTSSYSIQAESYQDFAPSSTDIHLLVQTFLLHSSQLGFFLNPMSFVEFALSPFDQDRPSQALLDAIYLWGFHLSPDHPEGTETAFLSRALTSLALSLSSSHPFKVIQTIQAEVLVSQYFFQTARILEGRYHLSAVISLAVGCNLHRNPSTVSTDLFDLKFSGVDPGVSIDEQTNAFWAVYSLNAMWGSLPGMAYFEKVTAPWPSDYDHDQQTPSGQDSVMNTDEEAVDTIDAFLQNVISEEAGMGTTALLSKATILFERVRTRNDTIFSGEMLDAFRAFLPSVQDIAMTKPLDLRASFLTHSLVHVAIILLPATASQKRTASALSVLSLLRLAVSQIFGHVNSVMGLLWSKAFRVLFVDIRSSEGGRKIELVSAVGHAMVAMSVFADKAPLIQQQLDNVRREYSTL